MISLTCEMSEPRLAGPDAPADEPDEPLPPAPILPLAPALLLLLLGPAWLLLPLPLEPAAEEEPTLYVVLLPDVLEDREAATAA
jgi:hypothetical protein